MRLRIARLHAADEADGPQCCFCGVTPEQQTWIAVAVRRVGDSPVRFDLGLVGSNHACRSVVHVLLRVGGVRRRASVPF